MFLDEVTLEVAGGRGGSGAVAFRREKFVPLGGPDGGDGGRGGDVVLVAGVHLGSLQPYAVPRLHAAGAGRAGQGAHRHGADGPSLQLPVPAGTVVTDAATGTVLADLARPGDRVVVAAGGRGGRGNARYVTAVRRAPRLHELGAPGEARRVHLELRLIADIGLVGQPNAGKSTLLATWTGAHPKIADYPFTTLSPNLGIATGEAGARLIVADVPGLIAGAHAGAGLGIAFLRHLSRTRLLVHVVDGAQGEPAAVLAAVDAVEAELRAHSPELGAKPRLLALNKVDRLAPAAVAVLRRRLGRHAGGVARVHAISALEGNGSAALLRAASRELEAAVPTPGPAGPPVRVYRGPAAHRGREVPVRRAGAVFVVDAPDLARMVAMTDLDNSEALLHLQRRLRRLGVERAVAAAGAETGAAVQIGDHTFTFEPDR